MSAIESDKLIISSEHTLIDERRSCIHYIDDLLEGIIKIQQHCGQPVAIQYIDTTLNIDA